MRCRAVNKNEYTTCQNIYQKRYYEKNREDRAAYMKKYYRNNKEHMAATHAKYRKRRSEEDPLFRFIDRLRSNISMAFKSRGKHLSTEEIIGCNFNEAIQHIEGLFLEGMSWGNLGEWHIDHIVPISLAQTRDEAVKLCNIKNLQPLWAKDNLEKSDKLTPEALELIKEWNLEHLT